MKTQVLIIVIAVISGLTFVACNNSSSSSAATDTLTVTGSGN